jgi:hypothetical protein
MRRRLGVLIAILGTAGSARAGDWSAYLGVAAAESQGTIRAYGGTYDHSGSYFSASSPKPPAGPTCPRVAPPVGSSCPRAGGLASMSGGSAGVSGGFVLGVRRRAGPVFELALGGEAPTSGPPGGLAKRVEVTVGWQAPEAWVVERETWRFTPSVAVGAGLGTIYKTHIGNFDYLSRDGQTLLASLRYEMRHDWALARVQVTYRGMLATHQVWENPGVQGSDSSRVEFQLDDRAVSHEIGVGVVIGIELGG